MKTREELNAIREEISTVSKKLHELSENELNQVVGGMDEHDEYLINAGARLPAWDLIFKLSEMPTSQKD